MAKKVTKKVTKKRVKKNVERGCFGFSQITLMRPFLLMILHFSQIGFTDDLTFMLNPPFKKTVLHYSMTVFPLQAYYCAFLNIF